MNSRGYGSILAVVLLFLVCVVGLALLGSYAIRSSERRSETGSINKSVYQAIVGNPELGTFGYLGDSGRYPDNLNQLLTPGTNGPLLRDVPMDNNGVLLDGFFGPLEYWRSIGVVAAPSTHGVVIISRGPDHTSSNTSASPNDALVAFVGTNPTVSGYATTPDNADNMVVPDIYATTSAINVGYTGTLTYNLTNRDTTSGTTLATCPAAYSLELVSDTRGATMERVIAPVGGAPLSMELVQGLYTMRLVANSNTNQTFYSESVSVYPGTTTTRSFNTNTITTGSTPAFTLRVTNQSGAALWVRRTVPGPAADIIGGVPGLANGSLGTASMNACGVLEARTAAGGGGSLLETWVMPNAITTRTVTNGLTNTLTITDQTSAVAVVLVGNPGIAVGSVYKLRRKVFTIPRFSRVQVLGTNGTQLQLFTSFASDQAVTY
jgi:hypothetical protein